MIRIFYIDKDPTYYCDLQSWLPGYCDLIRIPFNELEKRLPQLDSSRDFVLINPDYTGNNPAFLKRLIDQLSPVPAIFISDTVDLQQVVSSVKMGAHTYLHKKNDKSLILEALKQMLYREPEDFTAAEKEASLSNIIGSSPSVMGLKRELKSLKGKNLSVHLTGETGTGKDLAAQSLQNGMICVNCGAISETLLEAEFFGTKKGAFTDAVEKAGIFERANGSTVFLDEVGELSKSAQVKLLRVLENGTFSRVGDTREIRSDFRLVTASNRCLKEEVRKGNFREDLFYRITSLIIEIPPLRERKEDIEELSDFFLKIEGSSKTISQSAREKLKKYHWPGNVRELKQTILRAEHLSGLKREIEEDHIVIY